MTKNKKKSDESERQRVLAYLKAQVAKCGALRRDHPEMFKEQKHLQEGTPERAYWHYGRLIGMRDALRFVESGDSYPRTLRLSASQIAALRERRIRKR